MTKDYSHRAAPREEAVNLPTPGWVIYLYGFLSGILLAGIAWMILIPAGTPLEIPAWINGGQKLAIGSAGKDKAGEQPQKPRFDFYTILPEMEVVISDEEVGETVKQRPASVVSRAEPAASVSYRLQAGSFRKMSDADRQKAKLAMLGVEAEIQQANSQGTTFYRVLTRPVADKSSLNTQRKLFQQNGINSLVVQVKN